MMVFLNVEHASDLTASLFGVARVLLNARAALVTAEIINA